MIQPLEYGICGEQLGPVWDAGAVDHYDGQAQSPGSGEFRVGCRATSILGHDDLDFVQLHQQQISGFGERPAIHDNVGVRQGQLSLGRVDQTQQIVVLGVGREVGQMHPTHGQHDVLCWPVQCIDGTCDVGHMGPVIASYSAPFFTGECGEWNACDAATFDCIDAHLAGEGVRGVDHLGDVVIFDINGQPVCTAKSPDPLGQGLADGPVYASREGHSSLDAAICTGARESGGLRGAAQNQKVHGHG